MYQYCFSSAGNGRGAMSFLMSFALEPEIVTFAWIDNASVHFPLNIYATKGVNCRESGVTGRSCFRLRGCASLALSVKGVIDDEFGIQNLVVTDAERAEAVRNRAQ